MSRRSAFSRRRSPIDRGRARRRFPNFGGEKAMGAGQIFWTQKAGRDRSQEGYSHEYKPLPLDLRVPPRPQRDDRAKGAPGGNRTIFRAISSNCRYPRSNVTKSAPTERVKAHKYGKKTMGDRSNFFSLRTTSPVFLSTTGTVVPQERQADES